MIASLVLLLSLTSCAPLERGKASFYGSRGGKTASGERVNPKALTAAHRTLPFNTIVEVTATRSGRKVRVLITDRGPFIKGRIIDLTPAAFKRLAPLKRGVVEVTLRVIKMGRRRLRKGRRKRPRRRRQKHPRKKLIKRTAPYITSPFGPQGPALLKGEQCD